MVRVQRRILPDIRMLNTAPMINYLIQANQGIHLVLRQIIDMMPMLIKI
ncbi:hypothetical protein DES53_101858 [Roseimicrobium gellanilyticum]|uniref:Uncharacterized protein n=1 Tax=Roseimicrobium gellanilyticum TaxID=748857 RepID=A0A366HXL0_9BACT|nr:hypothetical protein DES53_101858 [Roseimicrobium gellanilyticum]